MTFREMRRLSFLRILDTFTKSPATVIVAVFFKLIALGLAVILTRELLDSDSIWDAARSLFDAVRPGDKPTL
jgi:hypothetical protein